MSPRKQPAISYRNSIWLFSFLLLLLFGVFTIGIGVNVLIMGREWRNNELNHFLTTSDSLQTLLLNTNTGYLLLNGDFSEHQKTEALKLLRPYQLNARDKVYLVFKEGLVQIFPVFIPKRSSTSKTQPEAWKKGWEGIRSLTAEYERADGVRVLASVTPERFTDAGPQVLIVVERDSKLFTRIDFTARTLMAMCLGGLVFAYIIVLYYGRKMTQPYTRLEDILRTVETTSSGILGEVDLYKDPVQRSIETFAVVVATLQEQEERLENLGNRLDDMVSLDSGNTESLLASVRAGVITFDADLIIQSVTSQVGPLLNMPNRVFKGVTCQDVFGQDSVVSKSIELSLRHRKSMKNREFYWDLPGFSPVWMNLSTTIIRSSDGKLSGIGCVVRDITVLKRLKDQVREKKHLAALGELSAGIAHEFRNPLGAIQGNAQYLAEEMKSGDLHDIAVEIRDEVQGLERIIRDFLSFARPFHPEISRVSICTMIEDELEIIETNYSGQIVVHCSANFQEGFVEIDENLFRQALRNVFTNACEAMNGNGALEVNIRKPHSTADSLPSGCRRDWVIEISDTGPGVDVARSEELFVPFTTHREGGTGLGLAIVKKIVLIHNGTVEFQDNRRPGATIVITLPGNYDPDQTLILRRADLSYQPD